ncbi:MULTISPECIES: (2Fe-2S)-binding protein [unclassified Modestobacter]|uniref:(2Fe-2S)-binding protein n=1 Tax=unclassified Modestobacter TaxID=2643866 RepID=UPI0022AA291E|nr:MULTISPECIES: (2Fe-2S)-binding protein [unclassified Modestobacter]MCZ2824225.1 (2Fe-2S)-binding protein [Modestobacter sp. VKM Ac-2981]MCZ2854247.1 (2Fe-2S)-binding protein [Modestobacter sp. VKM Ac-2982]
MTGEEGRVELRLTVDGAERTASIDPRSLLLDALRDELGAIAPKAGCRTGDCGACTVRVDGAIAKSCLRLAVADDGCEVRTTASMAVGGELTPLQQAFWDTNAFQCGFCLSGMLFAAEDLLERTPSPSETEVREAISGNLCRCTGYDAIVAAVLSCAAPPVRSSRGA